MNLEGRHEFKIYKDMLSEWNQKMNLTAIKDSVEVDIKHFHDCLSILNTKKQYILPNSHVVDIGTGAGFPGIPVKIVRPDIKLTLIDSLKKRISFLEALIERLQLREISCFHIRAEDAGKDKRFREKFDIVLSRAVAPLNPLIEISLPLIKVGGYMLAMKSKKALEEIKSARCNIKRFGGELQCIHNYNLKFNNEILERNIVVIKKCIP